MSTQKDFHSNVIRKSQVAKQCVFEYFEMLIQMKIFLTLHMLTSTLCFILLLSNLYFGLVNLLAKVEKIFLTNCEANCRDCQSCFSHLHRTGPYLSIDSFFIFSTILRQLEAQVGKTLLKLSLINQNFLCSKEFVSFSNQSS